MEKEIHEEFGTTRHYSVHYPNIQGAIFQSVSNTYAFLSLGIVFRVFLPPAVPVEAAGKLVLP